ncbi:GAF and ANTAR domain-containing protein [Streptomyces albidus (ex Kaewkla and Franco 2022)]|uniref:GAF and ANTAR domain-containing protein n=1 Tax=Streptomyces albidus (ex Kaewkla and Franco 2022) TaxID=722709 RepID=UPI0015EFCAEF|nr:GAF and ANTAR domain-containing protein [Streptomyces albidus (ex Kaewkla and Franco 2022)]
MREQRLVTVFVELADTLVDDFDVIDLLHTLAHRCVELLDVQAAGLMLGDQHGRLRSAAASSEHARLLDMFESQTEAGPSVECFHTGQQVINADLDTARWPRLREAAREAGFTSLHALPLRLRGEIIGTLNLFHSESRALSDADMHLGQALADISTLSILSQRSLRESEILAGQMQNALTSRVTIEQAKGVLSARLQIPMDEAFTVIRDHARAHHERLSVVAHRITEGDEALLSALAGDSSSSG